MASKLLVVAPCHIVQSPRLTTSQSLSSTSSIHRLPPLYMKSTFPSNLCLKMSLIHFNGSLTCSVSSAQELTENGGEIIEHFEEEQQEGAVVEKMELVEQSIWSQMKEIVLFAGPALGLWICGPMMSLIHTAVIGQGSSIELAALGPATVVCDYLSYVFMFLSVATSNMVATSLARQDQEEIQHHISVLLFVGLACGLMMLFFTRFFGEETLAAFTGPKNIHVVPAANTYVQIRGLAFPALLVGNVAQSASLGMKDSWGPVKALAAASLINVIGCIVLCRLLGYGIAGAAWAAMASQVISGSMMIQSLNKKGYNAFAFSIPSGKEFLKILGIAAPVFMTNMSKVGFYALLVYFATSMGTHTMAAHQVMVQTFCMCTVWGEPLSQTAQSFMPEFIHGVNRSLAKARLLLRSLVTIGAILGLLLGIVGTCVPWLFPNIFTPDQMVIQQMHKVLIPFFIALAVTPPTVALEGTLLAVQDLRYISLSMSGCFTLSTLVIMILSSRYGLQGCWFSLVGFQWLRFAMALQRLLSPNGVLHAEDYTQYELQKAKSCLVWNL